MKVLNDTTEVLDKKQHCVSLFVDHSKALDTIDHAILRQRLSSVGLSVHAVAWFANYLSERTQCTQFGGLMSVKLSVFNGVLMILLFTVVPRLLQKLSRTCKLLFILFNIPCVN